MTVIVPGTDCQRYVQQMYEPGTQPYEDIKAVFGEEPVVLSWTGENTARARQCAADQLAAFISNYQPKAGEQLNVVGFSHGGNVALRAAEQSTKHIDNLATIGTPVLDSVRPSIKVRNHISIYNPNDLIQRAGSDHPFSQARCIFQGDNVFNVVVTIGSKLSNPFANHGKLMWEERTFQSIKRRLNL